MSLAPWPSSTRRSLPTNVQRSFPGVNRMDAFTIPDDNATDIKNMTTANYPVLSVRPGYSLLGSAFAARVLGLGAWKQTELSAISNGTWYKYSAGSWSAVSGGGSLSTSANFSFTNFEGNFGSMHLLAANGVDAVKNYDGSSVANLTDAPSSGNFIEQYGERVWVAVGRDLHGCALGNATNWSTFLGDDSDPYIKTVESPRGESIVALKAGSNHLTIFLPNAIFEMFGYVPSDFRTLPVTYDVGVVSDQAIATVEGTMYFIHRTGLYEYGGGTVPSKEFSKPVQDLINRINPAAISKCCAGSNGKFLYFAIPIDSETEPTTIIEFNTEFRIFSVWKDYSPLNMASINDTLYIGGTEGQVRQVGASTSDNGTPINYYVVSKPFSSTSLSQKIMLKRAWVTAQIPVGSTMDVGLSKSENDPDDFSTVQTIPESTVVTGNRVIVPTTTIAFANYYRYKISGTGPADIIEFAREQEERPIY